LSNQEQNQSNISLLIPW